VRDALVAYSTPWCNTVTGFLTGVLTVVGMPFFLFYDACVLQPAAITGQLPVASPFPTCAKDLTPGPTVFLVLWPYLFGLIGAAYGYLRHRDLQGSLRWHWRPKRLRPYHFLALCAGYLAYASTAWLSGSFLLITGIPLLAVISGPVLLFTWQFVHDRMVYFVAKPTWEILAANTVRIWFPRRLGVPRDNIISARAYANGLLEVFATIKPELATEARSLAIALPGINRAEIYDANGMAVTDTGRSLASSVEAGRIVAQLRRSRAKIWATGGYEIRHDVVYDISGRMLLATVSIVALSIMLSLFWVALRGGFRSVTAEDLQWFFGKYGPSAESADIRALPKSLQPR
jgi:hypothetical protein